MPKSANTKANVEILHHVSIFADVDDTTLQQIGTALKPVKFEALEDIFKKGDWGTSMYVIVKGKVQVHDGKGHVFGVLSDSQVFGEYALLDADARSASITAIAQTEALMLDQSDFYEILGNNIEVVKGLLKVFTKRLRNHNNLQQQLSESNRKISLQKEEIELQAKELTEKNHKITSSINYAKRIQGVMLPTSAEISKCFSELFILYKPRDIVSGDFYWFTQKDGKYYFAVADCTGHGVPGALMTMTGAMMLNHAVKEKGITDVGEVLKELHLGIANFLNTKETNVQDGMDIAICQIDLSSKKLIYAGAKQPFMIIRDSEAEVIKANREPIGGNAYQYYRSYQQHEMDIEPNATYYMMSDGYQDQFSKAGKKFMRKRFRKLLEDISSRSLLEQHTILERTVDDWKKGTEQTDDILVVGFRV